jgi:3-oxoacyl-[acyl-carrier-protein] synthase II
MKTNNDNGARVVITGLGVISPIGSGKEKFWRALISGTRGVGVIESFDSTSFIAHHGCEVKGFDSESFPILSKLSHMGKASQFAAAAARMALEDAAVTDRDMAAGRCGVSLGTTGGEIQVMEKIYNSLAGGIAREEIDKQAFSLFPCDVIPANVASFFNISGPIMIFSNACAASNYAIGYAYEQIRRGKVDMMLAGGVETFSRTTFTGFCRMNAVAPDVCRPFDKNRKGLILGEGGAILILESLRSALARGARVYVEITGCGMSCDSFHLTSPDPSGRGMVSAMAEALAMAGLRREDIDYICAHGTGTPINDKIETLAIKKLFGDHAYKLSISSIKGMIGHTMGAASAIEAAACALAVSRDVVPPTINYQTKDPQCDLDCTPNTRKETRIERAMNNAFAFGGENTCIILTKYDIN